MRPQTIISLLLLLLILLHLTVQGSPASRLSLIASRDLARHRFISQQSRHVRGPKPGLELQQSSRAANSSSIKLRLYSATDFGVGEYLAELEIGTPPRRFRLFADTGSDLTWVKCAYRSRRGRHRTKQGVREFRADRSASFKTVSCGSTECSQGLAQMFSLATCPRPSALCMYNYSYQSGSLVAFGVFGNKTITLPLGNHRNLKLSNIIGCTESVQGTMSMKGADVFRNHCERAKIFGDIRNTRLFLQAIIGFYTVSIKGISIGGSMLDIPAEVWDVRGSGGAILDSGTSLTVLATPAYSAVTGALSKALLRWFPSLGSQVQPFSYCFKSTGFKESMVPKLVIHFSDGARFEPHVKSYIIDVMPSVKCIGILEGPGVPYLSVLGNILQQNYFWEYDLSMKS